MATEGTRSRTTAGVTGTHARPSAAVCVEGAQLGQAGGHRPSGPSSAQRSGQIIVGAMARETITCACIMAKRNRTARWDMLARTIPAHPDGVELTARLVRCCSVTVPRAELETGSAQEQKDELDEEIALVEMAADDARLDELDIEAVVAFAEHVLLNAARRWQEFSLIFRLLRAVVRKDESEVSPAGFEPTLPT